MKWIESTPQAATMSEDVRDKWAADLISFIESGDDAAYVRCGDSIVFAVRDSTHVLVFDGRLRRECVEPCNRSGAPVVKRVRRRKVAP